ncbi:hypothetical protein [Paenibacillus sp. AR247]|uniref:hypothetical protein n=1 Tax=Paenibacillus sp. AR247 TaxID=1631599 RepID=UPI000CFA00AF|nr:hypothetical protein [Paenibacillus sp. AR247]PQP89657.1 hypothetical protein CPT76_16805 [Paenibacillus sp. AR247]
MGILVFMACATWALLFFLVGFSDHTGFWTIEFGFSGLSYTSKHLNWAGWLWITISLVAGIIGAFRIVRDARR